MKTLYDSVNDVLKRLDDYPELNGESVWTRAEVELYVKDGYRVFCRQTKCVFDMFYPENVSPSGNYVAKWERNYFESGMIAVGLMNFTGGYWEKDYAEAGAIGPIRTNEPWEADLHLADMDDTDVLTTFYPVPEDNVAVERATYDLHQLSPEFTRWFEQNDQDFQETEGTPWYYSMDRDGISSIRVVPAGSGGATLVETSGTYGLLRDAADTDGLGTWAPVGSWGGLREIPQHFPMGGQYGIPRRLYSDTANTRVEYARQGKSLDEYLYELPDRFAKYPEFWACAKALEREGPGQSLPLAAHFTERFNEGVRRMVLRIGEMRRSVESKIGSPGRTPTKPALARLPWKYGRQIRRG